MSPSKILISDSEIQSVDTEFESHMREKYPDSENPLDYVTITFFYGLHFK